MRSLSFKELNIGEKILLIGAIVAITSLFLPWIDIGFVTADGFQQQGYIMIVFLIYPCIQALRQMKANKILSIVLTVIPIILMLVMFKSKSTNLLGTSINVAASGMYLMIVALIMILVGSVLNKRQ